MARLKITIGPDTWRPNCRCKRPHEPVAALQGHTVSRVVQIGLRSLLFGHPRRMPEAPRVHITLAGGVRVARKSTQAKRLGAA